MQTESASHAPDFIAGSADLEERYDGVLGVGGDGMFNVVFEALVRRHNRAAVEASASANPPSSFRLRPPSLRAGVIPAGSTDVAGHTLHGTSDQTSIALRVAMGEQRGLDALAVFVGGRFRCLSVTVASRGFFGDNLAWSEEMRWMGPTRYEAAGLMNLLKNKSFKGDTCTVYCVYCLLKVFCDSCCFFSSVVAFCYCNCQFCYCCCCCCCCCYCCFCSCYYCCW